MARASVAWRVALQVLLLASWVTAAYADDQEQGEATGQKTEQQAEPAAEEPAEGERRLGEDPEPGPSRPVYPEKRESEDEEHEPEPAEAHGAEARKPKSGLRTGPWKGYGKSKSIGKEQSSDRPEPPAEAEKQHMEIDRPVRYRTDFDELPPVSGGTETPKPREPEE